MEQIAKLEALKSQYQNKINKICDNHGSVDTYEMGYLEGAVYALEQAIRIAKKYAN